MRARPPTRAAGGPLDEDPLRDPLRDPLQDPLQGGSPEGTALTEPLPPPDDDAPVCSEPPSCPAIRSPPP